MLPAIQPALNKCQLLKLVQNVGCLRENSLCHAKESFSKSTGELLKVIEDNFFSFEFYFLDNYRSTCNCEKTEIPYTLYPASPMVTSSIIPVQYLNRILTQIQSIHLIKTLPALHAFICVCVFSAIFHMSRFL